MAEENNEARGYLQPSEPAPDLRALDRLVGTWELSGDVGGTVKYEWMEGGFFLIQHVDLGPEARGMEVIGHERPLGQEPSADLKSRFYGNTGDSPARHRLYRATASEHSVLGEKDQRTPVCLWSRSTGVG